MMRRIALSALVALCLLTTAVTAALATTAVPTSPARLALSGKAVGLGDSTLRLSVRPLTGSTQADAVTAQLSDGHYAVTVPADSLGLYMVLVTRSGEAPMQALLPVYAPVPKAKATVDLSLADGQLSATGSKDLLALSAFNAVTYTLGRQLWTSANSLSSVDFARRAYSYITLADSILRRHKSSAVTEQYVRTWAYLQALSAAQSAPFIRHDRADSTLMLMLSHGAASSVVPGLAAPPTVLDGAIGATFPQTAMVVSQLLPKGSIEERLARLHADYHYPPLVGRVTTLLMDDFLRHYPYASAFDEGLSRVTALSERYGLGDRWLTDYRSHAATLVGMPFPDDVVLEDTLGRVVPFSAFRGKKVYIDLWASWCVPCMREIPNLQRLAATHGSDTFAVVQISIDESRDQWLRRVRQKQLSGYQLHDRSGRLAKRLNVVGIPFYLVYSPDGRLLIYNAPRPADYQP